MMSDMPAATMGPQPTMHGFDGGAHYMQDEMFDPSVPFGNSGAGDFFGNQHMQ